MDASTRAPGYDLFKLIVAIILLILAIILMWISPSRASTPLLPTGTVLATLTVVPASRTSSARTATPSPISSSTATPFLPPSPTLTQVTEPTATPPSFPTATPSPVSSSTATPFLPPSPTLTQVTEPTATPPPFPPEATATPPPKTPAPTVCQAATSRSRLHVGTNATILRRLNLRSSPGIRDNWLLTNTPGTRVQIVGSPECVPYWTGAYLWWQIRLPDGHTGWSAEGSLHGSFYFMEPNE